MRRRDFLGLTLTPLLAGALPARAAPSLPDDEAIEVKDNLPPPGENVEQAVILDPARLALLRQVDARVDRVQHTVGYSNFNLLGFDQMLRVAAGYSQVGAFTQPELDFLEELFYEDASRYGFFGHKVLPDITAVIPEGEVEKVGRTGHFLYRGRAQVVYRQIRAVLGEENIVLTSGVRGTVKQMHLFFAKALSTGGNLSSASRSLAPPGYSYHGVGDFDVGKVGYGARNFTAAFAETDEYKKLTQLGYIAIRYPHGNPDGVQFEPWHIKVV